MRTGIELIAQERKEQIEKHGRTIEKDVAQNTGHFLNNNGEECYSPQLPHAANMLLQADDELMSQYLETFPPYDWDMVIWLKMCAKPYKERLIIAGALIAAEIDRLQKIENNG